VDADDCCSGLRIAKFWHTLDTCYFNTAFSAADVVVGRLMMTMMMMVLMMYNILVCAVCSDWT